MCRFQNLVISKSCVSEAHSTTSLEAGAAARRFWRPQERPEAVGREKMRFKQLASDEELRAVLSSLDFTKNQIDNVLEVLSEPDGTLWSETRDFEESAVTALGF
jgi:hypothetical protein